MAGSNKTLTIVLSTTLPSVFLISVAAYICYRMQKRKTRRIFKRGITPIEDEEIESWKVDRNEEKPPIPEPAPESRPSTQNHQPKDSVGSIQKPPSVIVYQNQGIPRSSEDNAPRCLHHHKGSSVDMPQTPVLARAPNARPGLTDDTVRGDDAFIPQLKRQPSRLNKSQPASPRHNRTRSARSSMSREQWHGQNQDGHQISPRRSAESFPRTPTHGSKHKRVYSSSNPPRMSLDDELSPGGLSPRPHIRQSEIGRAIG